MHSTIQDIMTGTQFMAAVSMFVVGIILALVNRGKVQSAVYNRTRWMIVAAMILNGIHMGVQFLGHFRTETPTTAWIINVMFYAVIAPLYDLGELNLLQAGHCMKKHYLAATVSIVICFILLAVGLFTHTLVNDLQPWRTTTCIIALCVFLNIVEITVALFRSIRNVSEQLTDDELHEHHKLLGFTGQSSKWLMVFTLFAPLLGWSSSIPVHAAYGFIMVGLMTWYIVCFILYGINMEQVIDVSNEIEEIEMTSGDKANVPAPQPLSESTKRIEQWVADGHFCNPNLTIGEALSQMGISANTLNLYLEEHTNVSGYRQWISYLRIEYTKRLMKENPDYKMDVIADIVGMSNGSALSRAFKSQEGISPTAWLEKTN